MYTSSGGSWKRQEIVAGVIVVGGLILFTLLLGRPGDLGAGLIGAAIFCVIGGGLWLINYLGSRLARKLTGSKDDQPSQDSQDEGPAPSPETDLPG